MMPTTDRYVTPAPWSGRLQHGIYATEATYHYAALWLSRCGTVADWGGGTGYFRTSLPKGVQYLNVDGTQQTPGQVVADLTTYREPSDGILLRHVLEHVADWEAVLANALFAFRDRMVVITFTPPAVKTGVVKMKSGWPVRHFNPDDLMQRMGGALVRHGEVETSHPEHLYFLERGR